MFHYCLKKVFKFLWHLQKLPNGDLQSYQSVWGKGVASTSTFKILTLPRLAWSPPCRNFSEKSSALECRGFPNLKFRKSHKYPCLVFRPPLLLLKQTYSQGDVVMIQSWTELMIPQEIDDLLKFIPIWPNCVKTQWVEKISIKAFLYFYAPSISRDIFKEICISTWINSIKLKKYLLKS